MRYRATIQIEPHWTTEQRERAIDLLLRKMSTDLKLDLDVLRERTTIAADVDAATGRPIYLATYETQPEVPQVQWPHWPYS